MNFRPAGILLSEDYYIDLYLFFIDWYLWRKALTFFLKWKQLNLNMSSYFIQWWSEGEQATPNRVDYEAQPELTSEQSRANWILTCIIIEHSGHVLRRKFISSIAHQHACFANCSIPHHNTLDERIRFRHFRLPPLSPFDLPDRQL